jgi:radical SAM protein with 4Fe4S-binding SPASM domain
MVSVAEFVYVLCDICKNFIEESDILKMVRIIPNKFFLSAYEIILTWNCNLRCSYCYECQPDKTTTELRKTSKEVISSEKITEVVDFITKTYDRNAKEISIIFWGGEPFLAFAAMQEFITKLEFAQQAKHIDKPIRYTTTSNLTIITLEQMQYLQTKRFSILVSLDGLEETTDSIRGKGTFAKVIKNMALLYGLKIPFSIRATFSPDKIPSLSKDLDFLNGLEQEFWWNFDHTRTPLDKDNLPEALSTLLSFYKHTPKNYAVTLNKYIGKEHNKTHCIDPYQQITIDPEGNLRICSRVDWIIGDILAGITKYTEIKDLSFYSGIPLQICADCLVYKYCKGGCIGVHFEKNKENFIHYQLNESFCNEMFLLQLVKENLTLEQQYNELQSELKKDAEVLV